MALRLTYMNKKSYAAITDPQPSLTVDIWEVYLGSKENKEQTLGTRTESRWLVSWVGSGSRDLLGD